MGFDWGGAMGAAAGLAGSALGVWGQSQTNALNAKEAQFQSTLPRGERRLHAFF